MYLRIFLLILIPHIVFSQVTVTIKGQIREAFSLMPLSDVSLNFNSERNKSWNVTTDTEGNFTITDFEPGRYDIIISAKGYQTETISNYLIGRSKGPLLFDLHLNTTDLPELVVTERKSGTYVHPLSNILTVTREETEKLPAGFFDPARLFTNQAGVSPMNDGANHLVIRGNNPALVKWMIHGTEIVNPNHLSNAGTFNDQASTSGGGVNMISATVLENSYLHKGPYNATVGNALAGALDLNLRKGNNESLKTEAQISLLGLELGLQGPLSKKGATFITRYRYSTVGLLADLGAKFGDEDISYQDFMFHVNIPSKKSDLSLFVFTGNNINDYVGKADSAERTIDKERYNIRFKGNQWISGLSHEYRLNTHNRLLTDIIYSKLDNTRSSELIGIAKSSFTLNQYQSKLNIHPRWVNVSGSNKVWTTGIQAQVNNDKALYNVVSPNLESAGDVTYTTLQPYSNLLWESGNFSIQPGVHALIKSKISLDPRLQLRYHVSHNQSIQLNLGKYSQIASPVTFFKGNDFDPMKSVQAQLSYETVFRSHTWTNAVFYQHHYDMPSNRFNQTFINESQGILAFSLNAAKANIYGIESSLEGKLNTWTHTHNISIFKSLYSINDISNVDGRFDQRMILHNYIGREWSKQKQNSKRLIGLFTGVHYSGSLKDSPIGATANQLYTIKRPDMFRLDFRIYRRKFYQNVNTLLALDIQNLTNQQNFSYSYFDTVMNKVNIQYQLGVLPNLSYTIEF